MAMQDPLAQYRFGGENDPRYRSDRRAAFSSLQASIAENRRVDADPRAAARERAALTSQIARAYANSPTLQAYYGTARTNLRRLAGRRSTGNT